MVDESGRPKLEVEYKNENKRFTPEEVSSMVLVKMKETAEAYLGSEVKDAVVTVPAERRIMSQHPAEFSLESVRQLMLANGGRITNHDLVKSFKRWLTDPQEKENARAQFEDWVTTLATIRKENGEKYLILKTLKMEESVRDFPSKAEPDDTTDFSSITTIDPNIKQWMINTSKGDFQAVAKMLMENPKLTNHRSFTTGYTGLHWACKHGNLDMVKLLAGTYQASVNVKTLGGYTPLHLAAIHNNQEVFDLLVQVRLTWNLVIMSAGCVLLCSTLFS